MNPPGGPWNWPRGNLNLRQKARMTTNDCPTTPDDLRRMAEMLRDVPGGIGEAIETMEALARWLDTQQVLTKPSRSELINGSVKLALLSLQKEVPTEAIDCDPLYWECDRLVQQLSAGESLMTSDQRIVAELVKVKNTLQVSDAEWADCVPVQLVET